MFKNIENLKIEDIYKGITKNKSSKIKRKGHAFFIRLKGSVTYTFSDKTVEMKIGDIIFLPKDSEYFFSVSSNSECEYISIKIEADLTDPVPFCCSLNGFGDLYEIKNNITELWKFGGTLEHYRCYSIFYNLLAYMENIKNISYIDKKKSHIIAPAISYLKKHIYDSDLKIDALVNLCGVSGTYFNKIFRANYGVTPQHYISSKRLSHAKAIIDSGDYDTITEIALSTGYEDPLYFSRAFKNKYGVCPSKYTKE